MKKICFTSLGCPRNLVDTEVMVALMQEKGLEVVPNIEDADFCVINTCGFLKEAREEVISVLKDIFSFKKEGAKVIVTGCMVEKFKNELENSFSDIFYFLGAGNVEDITKAVEATEKGSIISKKSFLEKADSKRFLSTPKNYAYLKIAEGCMKRCSYCLIPEIKGPLKSKFIDQIVSEFKSLLDRGVFEVILIAQDLGDYGKDLKSDISLVTLIKELLKIDRDFRIRLMYLYPDSITDDIIEVINQDERIYKYIDIPLQHINNDILKKMKRKTTKEDIISIIEKLRNKIPTIVIRTTLMVGFPSETNEQFHELAMFVKQYKLDRVGVFKYSNEEGVFSYSMEGQIPEEEKEQREKIIYDIQQDISREKNKNLIGQEVKVLIEGYHIEAESLLVGRMWDMAPEVDPIVIINDYDQFDGFDNLYTVQITDVAGVDLVGKIIKKEVI